MEAIVLGLNTLVKYKTETVLRGKGKVVGKRGSLPGKSLDRTSEVLFKHVGDLTARKLRRHSRQGY